MHPSRLASNWLFISSVCVFAHSLLQASINMDSILVIYLALGQVLETQIPKKTLTFTSEQAQTDWWGK